MVKVINSFSEMACSRHFQSMLVIRLIRRGFDNKMHGGATTKHQG